MLVRLQKDPTLTGKEKLVAWNLVVHRNATTGLCFPSVKTLEVDTTYTDKTLLKVVESLEQKRIVFTTKARQPGKKWAQTFYWFFEDLPTLRKIVRQDNYPADITYARKAFATFRDRFSLRKKRRPYDSD